MIGRFHRASWIKRLRLIIRESKLVANMKFLGSCLHAHLYYPTDAQGAILNPKP